MKRLIYIALLFMSCTAVAGDTSTFAMGDMRIVLPSDWLGPTTQNVGHSIGYNLQRPRPGGVVSETIFIQDTDVSELLSGINMTPQDIQARGDAAANTCLNAVKSSALLDLTIEPVSRCTVSNNPAACVNWSASVQNFRVSGVCVGWMAPNRHILLARLSDATEHSSTTLPAMLAALKSMQTE